MFEGPLETYSYSTLLKRKIERWLDCLYQKKKGGGGGGVEE